MKRRYETTIEIKPVIGNVGFESGTDSGDDIDSIQSEFYESALEQVERNFCDFDPAKINITVRDPVTRTSPRTFSDQLGLHSSDQWIPGHRTSFNSEHVFRKEVVLLLVRGWDN